MENREYLARDNTSRECVTWPKRVGRGAVLNLHLSATGIGDAICALYAACGAAHATRKTVRLHTAHTGWLSRARHRGVEVTPRAPEAAAASIDVSRDYDGQIIRAASRKQWYCDNIAPGLTPCRPESVDTSIHAQRFERTPYVVLAPFSHWPARHWPVSHWSYLVALLHDAGIHAVLLDGPGDGARLREAFQGLRPEWATWFWGHSEEWVADVILGARAVVGVDSGMTHYAALLDVPTVAVMAHLPPSVVFSHTDVRAVTPQTACTFCRWQPERGFRHVCDAGCTALASIAPERVLHAVLDIAKSGVRELIRRSESYDCKD